MKKRNRDEVEDESYFESKKKTKCIQIQCYTAPFIQSRPIIRSFSVSTLDKDGYKFGKQLGKGNFGAVMELTSRDGKILACKSISKDEPNVDIAAIELEVAMILRLSRHANVVHLESVYEDDHNVHLVMELCSGGDLRNCIHNRGQLFEDDAALIFRQLMETVSYFHEQGIVHRDLKPMNILMLSSAPLSWKKSIKIADFGLAAFIQPGQHLVDTVGTPLYMAPEVILGGYNTKADVWSCGIILYVMLCGVTPFRGWNRDEVDKAVATSELQFHGFDGSDEAKDLIGRMLDRNATRRLTAQQVLRHPWLNTTTQTRQAQLGLHNRYRKSWLLCFQQENNMQRSTEFEPLTIID